MFEFVKTRVVARLAAGLLVASLAGAASAQSVLLYAGSYTDGSSKGIYAFRFDTRTGALEPLGLAATTPEPAHLWIAPNGKTLYAVNWQTPGGVSAFRIDLKSGGLTLLNRVGSNGDKPNQVVLDPSGRVAVTVNYATGNLAAFRVLPDGRLSEAFYTDQHVAQSGSGGAHAHGIVFSKDGRHMFVAELGLDRVYSYEVDAAHEKITPAATPFVSVHAGAGPRRLQLSPDGRHLYVTHETDGEVSVFAVQGSKLVEMQTAPTLPAGVTIPNKTAEIIIDGSGRHLYVGNRGHDSIAVFDIEPSDGHLSLTANIPAGGKTPRNLRLDPTGRFLLSANEGDGTITVFKVDARTGALTLTGDPARVDTPGGLYFLSPSK
jgi:6-phosphogluconolactonase